MVLLALGGMVVAYRASEALGMSAPSPGAFFHPAIGCKVVPKIEAATCPTRLFSKPCDR